MVHYRRDTLKITDNFDLLPIFSWTKLANSHVLANFAYCN